MLLIEGTGHAGVGAVIGLSNAVVARMLGAPAIIVSEGGVGRPIDEIVLNASHFAAHGVPVAGAIVNKVDLAAQPGIGGVLERGLAHNGIRLLGVLPVRPILSNPTLAMVLDGVHGETIHSGPDLDRVIDGVAIGAMEPRHMLERVGPGTLVIVPGDREDVILTLTTAHLARRFRVASASEAARIAQVAAEATNERTANVDGHEGAAIGLVLTGFTGWHISLAVRGLTTIECLEKTRYLSPLRQSLDRHRAHIGIPGACLGRSQRFLR